MNQFKIQAGLRIASHLFFILLTFRSFIALRFDMILQRDKTGPARIFLILLACAIGFGVSSFVLDIIDQFSTIFSNL
ncbi:DUF1146 family protein [Schleiferilactobacillus perolens]|jgi:uncharacterized integral membrane protein (TIGR02327 family)|uniref:DUF1146 domain-containing protein n=1 Tax=Schleiferilactobacillus perolens DSM 12744 TaxID=1423792 RepID=A0A0R1N8S5_9LACO|nr:DUF1146 family protein [Schleiferilactobacillus perolens]KRL14261.1 hypothetical protein FD09_GL001429 [Schleiferilactobacillus perolens DSM 12744]MCI1892908.1 DUF1146 family protein [Schleiferilactobacillus harbinensis]MCI1913152.1 DUF1146 family protein [Schleiferilactobacillus harbinensis]